MRTRSFEDWATTALDVDDDELFDLKIAPAFEMFISRLDIARRRGATDPLRTVTSKAAGGNSRIATRRMLEQLQLTDPQRRAMHRLVAGTPSGWPGLLRLYVTGQPLKGKQRQYARRQVQILRRESYAGRSRRHSSAA